MSCGELPDSDNVVRYAGFTDFTNREKGEVNGSAFIRKPGEDLGHSVNWLEYFANFPNAQRLAEIRRLSRLDLRPQGGLLELNVGTTKEHLHDFLDTVQFLHTPLSATSRFLADPSHSDIVGLPPPENEDLAELVGDMIAECVTEIHPTRV